MSKNPWEVGHDRPGYKDERHWQEDKERLSKEGEKEILDADEEQARKEHEYTESEETLRQQEKDDEDVEESNRRAPED